ncbi:MAG: 5'-methylthioadenosine/adenosylhomocysteine nucleosidase [Bacteroides sp.]
MIGIISAMQSEHDQLAARLQEKNVMGRGRLSFVTGRIGRNEVVLAQSGIGKVNAALGAAALMDLFDIKALVSTGVAGGIDPVLQVTDVVASSRLAYHDVWCGDGNAYGQIQGLPLYFEADKQLLEAALRLNEGGELESRVHGGLICTGDQFISNRDELQVIKSRFPEALAVDMESAALAHTCYLRGVPFISFRIISDTPGAHEENFAQYLDFWKTMADRSFQTTWAYLSAL